MPSLIKYMDIRDSDIEEGLVTAAKLVEAYGDDYWPIFEKLEKELDKRQSRVLKVRARLRSRKLSRIMKQKD